MKNIFDDLSNLTPLFILGVPRSGTTFLHQILNTHPEIFLTDELREVSWLIKEAKKISEGFEKHSNPYPFNHGKDFSNYLLGNAGSLLAPFYYMNSNKYGKENIKYWGDKYPHFDEILPHMTQMFPRAKYIMIHRDLKDIMVSVQKGHKWDVEKTADYVCQIYGRYIKVVKDFPKSNIYHIHYDDLNENPVHFAKEMFEFLELRYDDKLLTKILGSSSTQSHSVRKNKEHAVSFDKNKASGKWKIFFDKNELEIVNAKVKDMDSILAIAKKLYKK